jgi:hypothetical protein
MGGSNVGLFNVHRTVITIIERRPILPINGTIFPAPITLSLTGIPSVETATIAPRRPRAHRHYVVIPGEYSIVRNHGGHPDSIHGCAA